MIKKKAIFGLLFLILCTGSIAMQQHNSWPAWLWTKMKAALTSPYELWKGVTRAKRENLEYLTKEEREARKEMASQYGSLSEQEEIAARKRTEERMIARRVATSLGEIPKEKGIKQLSFADVLPQDIVKLISSFVLSEPANLAQYPETFIKEYLNSFNKIIDKSSDVPEGTILSSNIKWGARLLRYEEKLVLIDCATHSNFTEVINFKFDTQIQAAHFNNSQLVVLTKANDLLFYHFRKKGFVEKAKAAFEKQEELKPDHAIYFKRNTSPDSSDNRDAAFILSPQYEYLEEVYKKSRDKIENDKDVIEKKAIGFLRLFCGSKGLWINYFYFPQQPKDPQQKREFSNMFIDLNNYQVIGDTQYIANTNRNILLSSIIEIDNKKVITATVAGGNINTVQFQIEISNILIEKQKFNTQPLGLGLSTCYLTDEWLVWIRTQNLGARSLEIKNLITDQSYSLPYLEGIQRQGNISLDDVYSLQGWGELLAVTTNDKIIFIDIARQKYLAHLNVVNLSDYKLFYFNNDMLGLWKIIDDSMHARFFYATSPVRHYLFKKNE